MNEFAALAQWTNARASWASSRRRSQNGPLSVKIVMVA